MDSPPYTMSKTKRRIYNMPTKRSGSIRKTILSTPCSASIICKGPKYRFPLPIYFISCQEEIAVALKEFYNRWCKRETKYFKITDGRTSFYCNNLDLLHVPHKPKVTFIHLKKGIQEFHRRFVLAPADKAANNVVAV